MKRQFFSLGGFMVAVILLLPGFSVAAQTARIDTGKTYVLQMKPCETEKELLALISLQKSEIEGLRKSIDTLTELLQSNQTSGSSTAPAQTAASPSVGALQPESTTRLEEKEGRSFSFSHEAMAKVPSWIRYGIAVLLIVFILFFVLLRFVLVPLKEKKDRKLAREKEELLKQSHNGRHSSSNGSTREADGFDELGLKKPHVNGEKPIDPAAFRAGLRAKAATNPPDHSPEVAKGDRNEDSDHHADARAAGGSAGTDATTEDGDGGTGRDGDGGTSR